ncbi:MAG: SIS domain-containing protein, partial [Clostridia bacterium]|nr:SIS domain-containing protein [Clostridia bacterium]
MKEQVKKQLELLIERYPVLDVCKEDIASAFEIIRACYQKGGKLLIAGNGGSASDAEHIVGELMKAFVKPRCLDGEFSAKLKAVDPEMGAVLADNLQGALPAIALDGHSSLST